MRHPSPAICILLLMPLLVAVALAHSLKELEDQLPGEEECFQPIDKAGPDLQLRDADGHVVRLVTTADKPRDMARRLAVALGHKFTKTADGYQMHGIVTHVIDREGNWRGSSHGLRLDPSNLVMFVAGLVNDVHSAQQPEPPEGFWWCMLEIA